MIRIYRPNGIAPLVEIVPDNYTGKEWDDLMKEWLTVTDGVAAYLKKYSEGTLSKIYTLEQMSDLLLNFINDEVDRL